MSAPSPEPHPFTRAVLTQLGAEIRAGGYSVRSMAVALGRDYNTYRRWVIGEREIPVEVLWTTLDQLDLDYVTFLERARGRLPKQEAAR